MNTQYSRGAPSRRLLLVERHCYKRAIKLVVSMLKSEARFIVRQSFRCFRKRSHKKRQNPETKVQKNCENQNRKKESFFKDRFYGHQTGYLTLPTELACTPYCVFIRVSMSKLKSSTPWQSSRFLTTVWSWWWAPAWCPPQSRHRPAVISL